MESLNGSCPLIDMYYQWADNSLFHALQLSLS